MDRSVEEGESDVVCVNHYYCHKCQEYVDIDAESKRCSRCNEGFIEEVVVYENDQETDYSSESEEETNEDPVSLRSFRFRGSLRDASSNVGNAYMYRPFSNFQRGRVGTGQGSNFDIGPLTEAGLISINGENIQNEQLGTATRNVISIIRNFNQAFSQREDFMEDVIGQLLGSFDNGVPPADENKLNNLNYVNLTSDLIEKTPDCPICIEAYNLGEETVILNCDHFFHRDCIVNWLRMHNTCPVCRAYMP